MIPFIFLGTAFFAITILLAWYITGYGLEPSRHFAIGFRAMVVSYLVGAGALFYLAVRLS